ncbi:MAG: type II toxin-antitoxin system RelB/DinJ family antitoxin [Candidatus Paceibacterota bacterium]|jgi:DNA-damage-inducible protein J
MTTTVQIRIDDKIKKEIHKLYKSLGLDISSATKMFYSQSLMMKGIPFQPRTANGFTPEYEARIIKETEWAEKHGKRYKTVEEMFKALNK